MKGLIISPDDRITIKFAIGRTKSGSIVGDTTSKMLTETFGEELETDTIEAHEASFRRPTFGDFVNITGKVSTVDGTGFDFSPLAIRLTRMKSLIKSWTLVDENDNPIPADANSINNLDPFVANIIGVQLDALLGGI
jgi:hypothetical protein